MKRLTLLLVLSAPLAFSQQGAPRPERVPAPTYSDMYCSGFISKASYAKTNYVVAGSESPHQTQFHQGDTLFLEGSGYQEGARVSVVRELRDANRRVAFPGQAAAISALGEPYAELAQLVVTKIRGKTAIAQVELSCAPIVVGDLVVPFQEKAPVAYRGKTEFERFPAAVGSVTGRIVMAKDFDIVLGTGQKVYLSAGADKGIKVGDYFRAVRNYDPLAMNEVEALSYKVTQSEESQNYHPANPPSKHAELLRRALAEMIVLNVTPTSSTAMITFAVESVAVGDAVELEGGSR
jgi:hypothetical protein